MYYLLACLAGQILCLGAISLVYTRGLYSYVLVGLANQLKSVNSIIFLGSYDEAIGLDVSY